MQYLRVLWSMSCIFGPHLIFFLVPKLLLWELDGHCLKPEQWAGGVGLALSGNLMAWYEEGIEIMECPDSWSLLPEECLWHCQFAAAGVCWGYCRFSVGCSMWESGKIKYCKEKHQSVSYVAVSQFRRSFLLSSFLSLNDQFCFSSLFLKLPGANLKTLVQMSMF